MSPRVVALGGGHGLAASLAALRRVTDDLTGIVTVADNGGSSGRLREEFGILPPGDLRMALAALCRDDEWGRTWADILQHRFSGDGPLANHALGNLLLAATWDQLGDTVKGLHLVGELLGAQGRVLPMASVPLNIEADVRSREDPGDVTVVRGQAQVAKASGQVLNVRLDPADPPACPESVAAIDDADWVVIGPGSWFTSVMPNLLVPSLRAALVRTTARRVLVLNLVAQPGETEGLTPSNHLDVLAAHAPDLRLDVVVADAAMVDDDPLIAPAAARLGARLVCAEVSSRSNRDQHDPERLATVFAGVFSTARVNAAFDEEEPRTWP